MEASSLDGDSARCSRQAWKLAAWMVILQPASDSKWICVDFMDSGGPGSGALWQPVARD